MEDEHFYVLEWRIENFSYWNEEIHGKVIRSPLSMNGYITLELYPKGLNGDGDHLVVQVSPESINSCNELSFIGSDGSILYTELRGKGKGGNITEFPPGPSFEKVVAQIGRDIHPNQLTVRYRDQSHSNSKEYMRTTIDASDVSFKISELLKESIVWFTYSLDEVKKGWLFLKALKDWDSKITLTLGVYPFYKKVSVLSLMTVLNSDGDAVRTEVDEHTFRSKEEWTFSRSLTGDELTQKGLTAIVHFKIISNPKYKHLEGWFHRHPFFLQPVSSPVSNRAANKQSSDGDTPMTALQKDLTCLYQDQDFSDFTLKCGDISIPVHRAILSARSPVLKSMLASHMQEAGAGRMDVVDIEPSTLARFVSYLYGGAAGDLRESALGLYYAADKYQVPSLKDECVRFLCADVSISNVCDVLALADKHQDGRLASVAQEFVLENYNDVLRSDEWKRFMEREPLLAVKTVTLFADKNYVVRNKTA